MMPIKLQFFVLHTRKFVAKFSFWSSQSTDMAFNNHNLHSQSKTKKMNNTLKERAILVNLTIAQWSGRKYDQTATKEVEKNHNTTNAGRFNKLLINSDKFKLISKKAGEIRRYHYKNTVIWDDAGARILPADHYFEYLQGLSPMKDEFEKSVSDFKKEYAILIAEAKQRLNGLFRESDYPAPANMEEKFKIGISFVPIPDIEDFRMTIENEEIEKIKDQMKSDFDSKVRGISNDLFSRAKELLVHFKEKMEDAKGIFRDSLIGNIVELSELLPKMNLGNNPDVDSLAASLKTFDVNPDDLRASDTMRASLLGHAKHILNKSIFRNV